MIFLSANKEDKAPGYRKVIYFVGVGKVKDCQKNTSRYFEHQPKPENRFLSRTNLSGPIFQ